jgi:FKBP-type peptidyl-prolyl cis-trans isomerase SlyD
MTSPTTISEGVVVLFHYTLTAPDGSVIDTSVEGGREPMPYLHGAGNIVPGLERQMAGRAAGDRFTAFVPAAEGYGDDDGEEPIQVPLAQLPDGVMPGMPLYAQNSDGEGLTVFVVAIEGDVALLSPNHPLAGVDLTFDVEVVALRAATAEEMQHGHPHGADGHEAHG